MMGVALVQAALPRLRSISVRVWAPRKTVDAVPPLL